MIEMIAIKLTIAIVGLWVMTRLLGKKEISQLTAFDFVSSLMLSELVGNTIYDKDVKLGHLLFALALWTCLSLGLEKLSLLFPRLGRLASGKPDLIIHNRKILYGAMRRNNLDFDQLHAMLRQNGVFALSQVEYAVLETNGSLSVMLTSDVEDETRKDLQPPSAEVVLPVALIVNGRIDAEGLRDLGKDGGWLVGEMLNQGVEDVKKVLYAEWSNGDGLHIQLKT
ncbi:DUF421 domain-containing protein [Cohnella sp. JJ-181]|uniref:DUF421 domain-containing protein n=1 Tax=Cohnella rhizoplanae TaxID=2974897 RepID=UPI0022FFB5F6|nr:DUF421 domain-containing protein [Cohnella sp. JJ-181]CAI6030331.1 hypothetical protein COHCIP112018_00674 [Cohnella sp. JJ-181]